MLRRLLSPARAASSAAAAAAPRAAPSFSTAPAAAAPAVEGTGLRRAAFECIRRAAPTPLHTKEVFERLDTGLPKDSPLRARLTLTHLKTKILRPMAESSAIKSVAVREEGKKRATFGWVVGKLPPSMKAAARAAAEQQ